MLARLFAAVAAILLTGGSAALAAPYACTRALLAEDYASITYTADRFDRIADYRLEFGFPPTPGCSGGFFSPIEGRINLATDSGTGSLSRSGTTERYVVTVLGSLGDEFFDDPDEFGREINFESRATPLFRLNIAPLGGYDPSYAFPNGFSLSSRLCSAGPGNCGPFYAVGSTLVDGENVPYYIYSDGGAPLDLGTIPVPAAFPLAATGLLALAGLGWRRRRTRAA